MFVINTWKNHEKSQFSVDFPRKQSMERLRNGANAREFVDLRGLEKPPEDLLLRRPRTVIMSVDGYSETGNSWENSSGKLGKCAPGWHFMDLAETNPAEVRKPWMWPIWCFQRLIVIKARGWNAKRPCGGCMMCIHPQPSKISITPYLRLLDR